MLLLVVTASLFMDTFCYKMVQLEWLTSHQEPLTNNWLTDNKLYTMSNNHNLLLETDFLGNREGDCDPLLAPCSSFSTSHFN